MSTKNDYSAEEWKAIAAAPVAAGLFISLSDAGGPVGSAKEALAVGRAITESAASGPEIVKALADSIRSAGDRPELPEVPKGDRATMKAALLSQLTTAATAVASKSPAEADAYNMWLYSVATKVSEAAKEGGFLGFGGTLVSDEEREGLRQLAETLGVRPAAPTA
jgi:hypothetical protein